ncbi:MAG: ABC transporter ATP-binding protein/permease [Lachnospiraceae bacterium]|nr:ABC transporter ATP-binding protein/permease [Lachnospiraceae bacterium]
MAWNDTVKKKPKDTRGTLVKLFSYMGKYKFAFIGIIALSLVSNVLGLLGPSYAGAAINEAAAGIGMVDFSRVMYYAYRMLAVYVLSSALAIVISVMMTRVSRRISENMRQDVFEKLLRMPVGFFDRNQAGDIISRVSYDIDVIGTCIATDATQILTSIVTVVGSLVMMVVISPLLSLTALITIPIAIGYTVWMKKITQPLYSKRSKAYGKLNGFVEEMFSGQKTIQAYAYEEKVEDRFDKINYDAADIYREAEHHGCTIGPTVNVVNNLGLALVAIFGAFLYMYKAIELGQISAFVLYSRKFSGPINEIANIMNEIYSALSAAERVFELLASEEEVADTEGAIELENAHGDVEMKNVSFGYLPDKTILHNLSLKADAGKLIAIVGPTGAGKTTIINLLMRFYDVDSGAVLVDEKDVRDYRRRSLRGAYAMVLQDTWVFNGTIFDNIAYGKENATREEVISVAKAAHIHSFIMRLPQGYDTIISEDGGNISKGQKQLLTIARAMLYDSRILILDEATSNVDTNTERRIQKAMRELMKDKTCFVIAHRLSTIKGADRILVANHGDVIEQGTHEQLMENKGFYYSLYRAQFE